MEDLNNFSDSSTSDDSSDSEQEEMHAEFETSSDDDDEYFQPALKRPKIEILTAVRHEGQGSSTAGPSVRSEDALVPAPDDPIAGPSSPTTVRMIRDMIAEFIHEVAGAFAQSFEERSASEQESACSKKAIMSVQQPDKTAAGEEPEPATADHTENAAEEPSEQAAAEPSEEAAAEPSEEAAAEPSEEAASAQADEQQAQVVAEQPAQAASAQSVQAVSEEKNETAAEETHEAALEPDEDISGQPAVEKPDEAASQREEQSVEVAEFQPDAEQAVEPSMEQRPSVIQYSAAENVRAIAESGDHHAQQPALESQQQQEPVQRPSTSQDHHSSSTQQQEPSAQEQQAMGSNQQQQQSSPSQDAGPAYPMEPEAMQNHSAAIYQHSGIPHLGHARVQPRGSYGSVRIPFLAPRFWSYPRYRSLSRPRRMPPPAGFIPHAAGNSFLRTPSHGIFMRPLRPHVNYRYRRMGARMPMEEVYGNNVPYRHRLPVPPNGMRDELHFANYRPFAHHHHQHQQQYHHYNEVNQNDETSDDSLSDASVESESLPDNEDDLYADVNMANAPPEDQYQAQEQVYGEDDSDNEDDDDDEEQDILPDISDMDEDSDGDNDPGGNAPAQGGGNQEPDHDNLPPQEDFEDNEPMDDQNQMEDSANINECRHVFDLHPLDLLEAEMDVLRWIYLEHEDFLPYFWF